MEQLIFFADLPSIDVEELEGRIDPKLDAAFMAEVAEAFAALPNVTLEVADVDAA